MIEMVFYSFAGSILALVAYMVGLLDDWGEGARAVLNTALKKNYKSRI